MSAEALAAYKSESSGLSQEGCVGQQLYPVVEMFGLANTAPNFSPGDYRGVLLTSTER